MTTRQVFNPVSVSPARAVRPSRSALACRAQKQEGSLANVSKALAAAALAVAVSFAPVSPASADISGLTPCAKSKAYDKVKKKEIKGLQKRQKQYEVGSAPYVALQATIDRTEARFANYAKSGVLCGSDGLPHLIADPGLALRFGHAGEILIPTFGFLYVAGYIGYTGRLYLNAFKNDKKPTEKEIIIDVPKALNLAFTNFAWPVKVVEELRNGTLTEDRDKITVSPR